MILEHVNVCEKNVCIYMQAKPVDLEEDTEEGPAAIPDTGDALPAL